MNKELLQPSTKLSLADVAHGTLTFDQEEEAERLILELIDTRWMQRLRRISQTGNTRLVYMFAEHSRFGHSLGVAYLATLLMKHLRAHNPEQIKKYEKAVAAAAVLHDIGHIAPGSHLAERVWALDHGAQHEMVSIRIIKEDPEISGILRSFDPELPELVAKVLQEDESLPSWASSIISGGGWNADRGNWAIVDSAMCAVSYGRYNVSALVDAFRLSPAGEMLLHESRLDALTHFFVARDSMYRQIYQHRVLQAVDALTHKVVLRMRDLLKETLALDPAAGLRRAKEILAAKRIYADDTMRQAVISPNYAQDLELDTIFNMTESWWTYHLERWCESDDRILADLARRQRDRDLLKTIRLQSPSADAAVDESRVENDALLEKAKAVATELGFDPRYYVVIVQDADAHRGKDEQPPLVLLDTGAVVPVSSAEPLIAQLLARPQSKRRWVAVPKAVKEKLGYAR